MTTQSKSVLIPFLIIAGLIFSVAVAWKFLGNHDEETVVKPTEVEMTTPVKVDKKTTTTVVDYDQPEPFIDYTEEDKEMRREDAKSRMKFSMRYSTFDKAITALDTFRANGNDLSAEELIEFIHRSYPNETIPADLLD